MSIQDGILLVGGIIMPLAVLVVYSAIVVVVSILALFMCFYQIEKYHLLKSHPDRVLLEEIRQITRRK